MAYDEELAGRVRELLAGEPTSERRMFGGLAFLVGGHLAVAASTTGLMVRVGPDRGQVLLQEPGTEPVVMGSRGPMRGWLRVRPEALADDEALEAWVRRGVACARTVL